MKWISDGLMCFGMMVPLVVWITSSTMHGTHFHWIHGLAIAVGLALVVAGLVLSCRVR